jgi:predicted DCC family thiol-disulfide oxidoreductase YuxK
MNATAPLLIFDGDCSFCRLWIDFWKQLTGDRVAYAPYQEVAPQFPHIPSENFQRAVHLILPDGEVLSAAQAVFCSLAVLPKYAWMLWAYHHVPAVAAISEWAYCQVAAHRSFFYRATVFVWGRRLEPASYEIATRWFLRSLGLIYLIAFLSLEVQVAGLIGSHGILPVSKFLAAVEGGYGGRSWLQVPTIFWLGSSDAFLKWMCFAGAIAAVAVIIGAARRAALLVAFTLYLSFVSIGQAFFSFQWDFLLLEVGFLAIFLLPVFPRVWLLRWLLFRLMFLSGTAKLLSGDPTWRSLTALQFHYQTQPLPTVFAWFFHHLPPDFQKASAVFMFFVELVVPFLLFAPRRVRFFAGAMTLTLQAIIFLTGNYTFFNLLAVPLCLSLYDDAHLRRFTRLKPIARRTTLGDFQRAVTAALFSFILLASCFQLMETFSLRIPAPAASALSWIAPFGIVNTYGLFAVMTTSRPEIIVEGSNDAQTWLEYGFKYKPGHLKRAPVWVQPHQPRLDWQMWFAALGSYQGQPWFVNFMVRLLEGSPEVLALMATNPFPSSPPQYVRARLYDYKFASFAERRSTGNWWRRELRGEYFPVVSLKQR